MNNRKSTFGRWNIFREFGLNAALIKFTISVSKLELNMPPSVKMKWRIFTVATGTVGKKQWDYLRFEQDI
jgi:hypothetical protein